MTIFFSRNLIQKIDKTGTPFSERPLFFVFCAKLSDLKSRNPENRNPHPPKSTSPRPPFSDPPFHNKHARNRTPKNTRKTTKKRQKTTFPRTPPKKGQKKTHFPTPPSHNKREENRPPKTDPKTTQKTPFSGSRLRKGQKTRFPVACPASEIEKTRKTHFFSAKWSKFGKHTFSDPFLRVFIMEMDPQKPEISMNPFFTRVYYGKGPIVGDISPNRCSERQEREVYFHKPAPKFDPPSHVSPTR